MKTIEHIFDEIKSTTSTKEKFNILNNNKDNELLKKILKYAYDKVTYTYGVTFENCSKFQSIDVSQVDMFDLLDALSSRKLTGHAALKACKDKLNSLNDDFQIFKGILDRDLKLGVSEKTLNKIWKGIIPKPKYCRCDVFNNKNIKNFEFPAYIQLKCDGTYREAHVINGEVHIKTRSGEPYNNPVIESQMKGLPNGYYMGEFTIGEADKQFNRFTANGNINSDNPDFDNIHFTMWDYITEEEYPQKTQNKPYYKRFEELQNILVTANQNNIKNLHIVTTVAVDNINEALNIVSDWMSVGLEGGVLKAKNAKFKDGTSKEQLKIKLCIDTEMRCKGFILGTEGTKYEGKNKVILFENDEGTIKGQCSGMTDSMVEEVTKNPNKYIGKVLTIQFNDLSKADNNDYYALSHPRFIEWRDDKDETDTLEKAFKMKEMATTLKD